MRAVYSLGKNVAANRLARPGGTQTVGWWPIHAPGNQSVKKENPMVVKLKAPTVVKEEAPKVRLSARETAENKTVKTLTAMGVLAGVAERWIARAKQRIDLFGFADIVAVDPNCWGVTFVQATTRSNVSHRVNKLCVERSEEVGRCLEAFNRVEVWGWENRKEKGVFVARRVSLYRQDEIDGGFRIGSEELPLVTVARGRLITPV